VFIAVRLEFGKSWRDSFVIGRHQAWLSEAMQRHIAMLLAGKGFVADEEKTGSKCILAVLHQYLMLDSKALATH
jgi:hypothetical protein